MEQCHRGITAKLAPGQDTELRTPEVPSVRTRVPEFAARGGRSRDGGGAQTTKSGSSQVAAKVAAWKGRPCGPTQLRAGTKPQTSGLRKLDPGGDQGSRQRRDTARLRTLHSSSTT